MDKDSKSNIFAKSRNRVRALGRIFRHGQKPKEAVPDALLLNRNQQRALIIAAVIALLAGFYLVKGFFLTIAISLLMAVIFHPVYKRLNRRFKSPGAAASLTLLIAMLAVVIPLIIITIITVGQVSHLINQLNHAYGNTFSVTDASNHLLNSINRLLDSITQGSYQITATQLHDWLTKAASSLANGLLDIIKSSFSGMASLITELILFVYIFTSFLTHSSDLVSIFKKLNPLGDDISSLYVSRTAAMIKGSIGGQFVIAFAQGVTEAGVLYIAGLHYFAFFAMILTALSIIPLGGGILAIPIGIIQILVGNVWQGVFILLMHFLVITNIDNVLRPKLVPASVRMNSALMMLAVFGGIGLFGFLGIFIGPVIMILVITTLQTYIPLAEKNKETAKT